MGILEERGHQRAKRRNLKQGILKVVQTAALVGAFIAAPGLPVALHKLGLIPKNYHPGTLQRARRRLIEQGLIRSENGLLRLTEKGVRAFTLQSATINLKKGRRRWDERWRVLIFDVPEYRRKVRDKMRRMLVAMGFLPLQRSVWVYPYDCEDVIVLLKADLRIGKDMLYLIVDELENDKWLRKEF